MVRSCCTLCRSSAPTPKLGQQLDDLRCKAGGHAAPGRLHRLGGGLHSDFSRTLVYRSYIFSTPRYKAGALSHGMRLLGDSIDYVAVFDSDFQPSPDFLRKLVPYLIANPTVGWVQV